MDNHPDGVSQESSVQTNPGVTSAGAGASAVVNAHRPFFMGRFPFILLLLFGLVGLFATGFLTYRHVLIESHSTGIGQSFLCRSSGKINCDAILMTEYSMLFGYLSSAALGLMGFAFVLWSVVNALFNDRIRKLAWVLLVAYFFAAIGFSWYFVYIMAFEVDFICTWCIVVHVMNFLSLITVIAVSVRNRKAFLLKEIATLAERVYFVAGCVLLPVTLFAGVGMCEKSLRFDDLKVQYEELANDTAVVMAIIRSSPTYAIPTGPDDPVFGAPEAPYAIFMFSDFQCPGCAKAEKALRELVSRNKGVLKLVYKNYPLSRECNESVIAQSDFHPRACEAARAAYAAYLLGGSDAFWAYGDMLFANQKLFKRNPWTEFAEKLRLNVPKFEELMKPDSPAARKVAEDVTLGVGLQLNGTPKVFFEGKRIPDNFAAGYLVEALDELIRANHPGSQTPQINR